MIFTEVDTDWELQEVESFLSGNLREFGGKCSKFLDLGQHLVLKKHS